MKVLVKENKENIQSIANKQLALMLVFLLCAFTCIGTAKGSIMANRVGKFASEINRVKAEANTSPAEILRFTETEKVYDNRLKMEVNEKDPLKYLALKQEVLDLYLGRKNGGTQSKTENYSENANMRFKEQTQENPQKEKSFIPNENVKPDEVGKIGNPSKKEFSSEEVVVPIKDVFADSTYIKYGAHKEVLMKFDAKNVFSEGKFWCSSGQHDVKDEIKFFVEFEKSHPVSAMWIYWAFAPGEFRVKYSNDKKVWEDPLGGYRLSIKNGDVNWWRSILMNAKTRWQYKSFDEKIVFDEPFFARYIELSLRIPVNQYFGVYSLEFYMKAKVLTMIKSKTSDVCLSVANGLMTNNSPVFGVNCLQAISYGDNRDAWVVNSNGFITSYNSKKCLQSPSAEIVNVTECGIASDFKDDREKWILDYDGKIRSAKDQFTCLTLVDESFGDGIPNTDIKVTATSIESSGNHNPENALDPHSSSYWASNPSNQEVIFEIFFNKYPLFLKKITIDWKFPAKSFKLLGLLVDGFWKVFHSTTDNKETVIHVNMNNYDLSGVRIIMTESTTKFDEGNIYGINQLRVHTGARVINRELCTEILGGGNLWELVYIYEIEDVSGKEYNKAWSESHIIRNKFDVLKKMYSKVPETLLTLRQNSVEMGKKLLKIQSAFDDTEKRISKYEDFLQDDQVKHSALAVNQYFPASDCSHIIKAFPNKRSGYYWIKNDCMPKALRVYCDFDSYEKKSGLDYYVFNDNMATNARMSSIKGVKDVSLMCNKLGLEPIELKSYKMLKKVIGLLKENNFNFNSDSPFFVPLGYDYSCDYSSCSKLFRSFNKAESSDINDLLTLHSKETSSANMLAGLLDTSDSSSEEIKNTAGIGASYSVKHGQLSKKEVVAVVCSTNKDSIVKDNSAVEITCDTNLRESRQKLEVFSHLRFICPAGCSESKTPVYGTAVYTDNSSICKAALHSGVIKDSEGGVVELGVEPGSDNYKGSPSHNVESLDLREKWDKSFKVAKFKPYCPIDKIKDYAEAMGVKTSFLSVSEQTGLVESLKADILSQLDEIAHSNPKSPVAVKNADNRVQKLLLASELLKFVQKNSNSNEANMVSATDSNNLAKDPTPTATYQMTTDEAIVSLTALNSKDSKVIEVNNQIASAFKTLIGKSINEIQILNTDKNIGLDAFQLNLDKYNTKIDKFQRIIYDLDSKTQIALKKSEYKMNQLKGEIERGQMSDDFTEDYNSPSITEYYQVYNSPNGTGETAKWEYYQMNLDGHNKVIKQTGEFIDNHSGSHLVINNRDFYDFEMTFSVMIQGSNTFGVAFRYTDNFNYYIFEISNKGKGFKRVRRFQQGESKIIDVKYDGGFMQNTWYNIKITGQQHSFKIFLTTDNTPKMKDHYDLVFEFIDNQLIHGTFAFASLGLPSLMIDNISAVHLSCKDSGNKPSNNVLVLTPDCARYVEDFSSQFNYNWKKIDPTNPTEGPSVWQIVNYIDGREKVLYQSSKIHGLTPNEEGTIFILNKPTKICSRGRISLKFKASQEGIVGIVFRYDNEGKPANMANYYLLEISGGKEKFIRMRRKIGNNYTLLGVKQLLGYTPDTWVKVSVLMDENKFNAYITDENGLEGNLVKVFDRDIIDNEIKIGLIGLTTFKTPAFFDEITLGSVEEKEIDMNNLDSLERRLFVDEEKLPLPKNKIPTKMFDRLNSNINNYSWDKCVKYATPDEKGKVCELLFKTKTEVKKCNTNFCDSCCEKNTDSTNHHYNYLCKKQCESLDPVNENNKSWKHCFQPTHPDKSIYPYCDSTFPSDFYQQNRCKVDMCNLCCSSFDFTTKSKISKLNLQSCYKGCIKKYDIKPDRR